jgi:prefoldin subunit 5
MREQLRERIEQLAEEYRNGEAMLADLDQRRAELQATMLRISGALQVLRELIGPVAAEDAGSAGEPAAAAS